jgi:hypothetical protein
MTTSTDTAPFDIDIACSLSATEQAERGEEFADLFAAGEEVAELADGHAMLKVN